MFNHPSGSGSRWLHHQPNHWTESLLHLDRGQGLGDNMFRCIQDKETNSLHQKETPNEVHQKQASKQEVEQGSPQSQ